MKQYYLGIEFGSTRVKAVLIDGEHRIVKSGDYTWKAVWKTASGRIIWRMCRPTSEPPFATSANCPAPFRPWAFPA